MRDIRMCVRTYEFIRSATSLLMDMDVSVLRHGRVGEDRIEVS